ncbi:hypothetical protein QQF64_035559 [Cirrhinus molitorella]|uniref:Uncharacterized protein n=1 Tax=Cirrhinus molitorella TaxID=172907 RepID=A0ABR3NG48_9TELE
MSHYSAPQKPPRGLQDAFAFITTTIQKQTFHPTHNCFLVYSTPPASLRPPEITNRQSVIVHGWSGRLVIPKTHSRLSFLPCSWTVGGTASGQLHCEDLLLLREHQRYKLVVP